MNLDDLKSNWKQYQTKLAEDRFDELASRVLTQTSWFEKTIWRRDLLETAAAIFVAVIFGYVVVRGPDWPLLARLGMGIAALGAIEIIIVLNWTRRRGRARHDLPLIDFCAAELARVDRQIWLLRNVNWWYTSPILLGCCTFFFGLLNSLPGLPSWARFVEVAIYFAFLLLGWVIYGLNQQAVRDKLLPLREELADIYESLVVDKPSTPGDPK
jgi:hypothetical protein